MHNKPQPQRFLPVLCLLAMLFGLTPLHAQSNLDFSVLDDSNPATTLSVTEGYRAAISDGGWVSLHSDSRVRWSAPYADDRFQQAYNTMSQPNSYESYLVSPALSLSAISGKTLSVDWSATTVRGDITLRMLVIDKTGATLATLGEVKGESGKTYRDWTNVSFAIPASLTGNGFIAFATGGDRSNRASFNVSNIQIVDGSQPAAIRIAPDSLEFSETNVGEASYEKSFNVVVSNYDAAPTATLTDGDTQDFTLVIDSLTAEGGKLFVFFTPKSAGEKQATLTLTAGDATATAKLKGTATGSAPIDKPSVELLTDEFFYEFTNGRPSHWQTAGLVRRLDETDAYNSSTGYGVGITTGNTAGYLRQTIDLTAQGKEVEAGDEIECLIHYFTVSSNRTDGPFRLALRWLDADNHELQSTEGDLINNPDLYFGRHNAWGTLKFRTLCPAGASKLVFGIEVAPNSNVKLDDFSATRLDEAGKTPLVAILPQYLTLNGEVGISQQINVAMQGMHLSEAQLPTLSGNSAIRSLVLNPSQLPANGTQKGTLTFTPQQRGAFVGGSMPVYSIRYSGADDENTGSLSITAYVKAAGTTPAVALAEGYTVRDMQAEPSATDTQTLDFAATDVIASVNLSIEQPAGGPFRINTGQFYYSGTSGRLLNHTVNVTFAPKQAGTYDAVLRLVTPLADTLRIPLHGVSTAADASAIVERFTAQQPMDSRFTGEAWKGYSKFDRGYWRLDGTFNGASNVTLNNGYLYYDELIADGVDKVTLYPAATAQVTSVEYSVDGGGHWTAAGAKDADGSFTIGSHRPTLVRIVNATGDSFQVDSVSIQPANSGLRQSFASIEAGMLRNADEAPLALLNETFTGLRHTRILGLPGWQNLTLRGERPFYGWQQRDASQTTVENEVAQISFYRYATEDPREQETWLVSPTLSYKQAAGKTLTFRLRFANAVENGGEQFGFYIITENNGVPAAHYVDLTSMVPEGITVEAENWYDYALDLSKVDSLDIDDLFHIAFSFYSPQGGSATTLNFMVDDVTFGRTDLPVINVDNQYLVFEAMQGVQATPQTFTVTTTNAIDPVTVLLVPSSADNYFSVSANTLPAAGGTVEVGFKTDDANDHAAMALLQTRGAASVAVRMLARVSTPTGISNIERNEGDKPKAIYNLAGQRLRQPQKGINIIDGKKIVVK